jgi:hypothetical protein
MSMDTSLQQLPQSSGSRVNLLDAEEALTPKLEEVLLAIFRKYASKKDVRILAR